MTRYELPSYRPPSEARSLLVRATRNCPWNRCAFCVMYKGSKFELRLVEEVKQDILAQKAIADEITAWAGKTGNKERIEQVALYNNVFWLTNEGVKNAFIGDSNSLIMKTDELVEVIKFLYKTFPSLERVTCYARAKTVIRKKTVELIRLKEAGLSRLHLGLETGDDELLAYMEKGSTPQEMIEAGRRVKQSGISLSEYVILGLGGKERWEQHALGTARVLNEIDPDFIRLRTLMVHPNTTLAEMVKAGELHTQSAEEVLIEERKLIENLEVTSRFVSDHVSNYLALDGKLPEDKSSMLEEIDRVLKAPPDLRPRFLQQEAMRHL